MSFSLERPRAWGQSQKSGGTIRRPIAGPVMIEQSGRLRKSTAIAAIQDTTRSNGAVINRLDVIAVRVQDEGPVIVLVILRSQAWRAVVATASCQCCAMESVDLFAAAGAKGYM